MKNKPNQVGTTRLTKTLREERNILRRIANPIEIEIENENKKYIRKSRGAPTCNTQILVPFKSNLSASFLARDFSRAHRQRLALPMNGDPNLAL